MFDFLHQTIATLAIHGNAFIFAPRTGVGAPVEMINLHPLRMNVIFGDNGNRIYSYGKTPINSEDIYHISWLRFPEQAYGVSPLDALRNVVGTGIAIDRFLAQFYGDGATPSSVLETDQQVTKEQAEVLRDTWEDAHWKRRRPAVLAGGLKWRSITASASDMDTMAHREAIVRDIARAYRIPLHLMSGTGGDSQTYQNVESAGINFVRHTLLPWMRRIEDTLSSMLPFEHMVRLNADGLMRADLHTRVMAEQIQIQSGTLSPNEARAIEGREPYEGGDSFFYGQSNSRIDSLTIGEDAIPPVRIP
jgi:HK97 family phage portal protein